MGIQNFSWVIDDVLAGSALPGICGFTDEHTHSDLHDLENRSITTLVTLNMAPREFKKCVEKTSLKWVYYPLSNGGTPKDLKSFSELVKKLLEDMESGEKVTIHCHAGIGRTGLLLGCLLGKFYQISGEKALALLEEKRTEIDSVSQKIFVIQWLKENL